jgi:hypothetical protein
MERDPQTDDEKLIKKIIGKSIFKKLKSPNFMSKLYNDKVVFGSSISLNYPIVYMAISMSDGNFNIIVEVDKGGRSDRHGGGTIDMYEYEYSLSDPDSIDKIRDKIKELIINWEYRPEKHVPKKRKGTSNEKSRRRDRKKR